jgi:hypothetical protein
LDGCPPSAGGGSCVFGTVGAECALVKRCNNLAPGTPGALVKGVTNLHLVEHPFAPGRLGEVHLIHLHTRHALCVCSNYLHLCGRTMFASKQVIFCTQNTMEGFFLQHKAVLESQYQAPVV